MTVTAFQQANQLLREGKLEEAVVAYRQAIEHNPQFYGAYQNLGEVLVKVGQVEDAITAFRQAVALNSQDSWSLYHLGETVV
ncbi:MAG: tetratricopeptide repeat protein [Planktothrix sp. GU0601_MAG3]|nr:MAG: tetratricopeptide repeat protein [Planktothrix sp. GU0601_MAG3]